VLVDVGINLGTVEQSISKRSAMWALLLLVPVPSVGAYMGLIGMPDTAVGKAAFTLAKVWLIALPVLWHWRVDRLKVSVPRPHGRGMGMAVVTGMVIFVGIAGAYWLIGRHWIDAEAMRETATRAGLGSPAAYLIGAIYWCTLNSLAEEYVWRWFVFTRFKAIVGAWPAVVLSGLAFTLHHIIALAAYFDWRVTVLASLGVFIGGATWSWLYLRYRNIYAAYVSHVFADLIIFYLGWRMIFGGG